MKTNDLKHYSKKVYEVLGEDKIKNLHRLQEQSLNNQLHDLLEEHGGDVGTITKDEIIGRYELVTKHIYPNDFLDLI